MAVVSGTWGGLRKCLLMIGLAFLIFMGTVFIERRDVFLLPFLGGPPVPAAAPPDQALVQAVRDYNLALVEAYRRGDVGPASQFPGEGEVREDVERDLRFLGARGQRLALELGKLEFTEARAVGGITGFVTCREEWRYVYADSRTGRPLGDPRIVNAETTYLLERQGERWRVVETGLKRRMSNRAG